MTQGPVQNRYEAADKEAGEKNFVGKSWRKEDGQNPEETVGEKNSTDEENCSGTLQQN